MKFAACSIFFNPTQVHVENIRSFIDKVGLVVVVDNSVEVNTTLLLPIMEEYDKIVYIPLEQNCGIAKALNVACQYAFDKGYDYILTMDQDSYFKPNQLQCLINTLTELCKKDSQIGIVCPHHQTNVSHIQPEVNGIIKVPQCITSGNLLSLTAWHRVGGFNEAYFIDFVDYEFCMRLRKHGYAIYKTRHAVLSHELGDVQSYKLLGKTFTSTNHSSTRRYYITRNRIDAFWKYLLFDPGTCLKELYYMPSEIIKIVLFEENKLAKMKGFFYGIHDFILAKFGPLKRRL